MFRFCKNPRSIYNSCKSLTKHINQQRYQSSSKPSTPNVALEPNTSKMSIFSGHIKGELTTNLQFIRPENLTPIPIYQVLDSNGVVIDESQTPNVNICLFFYFDRITDLFLFLNFSLPMNI